MLMDPLTNQKKKGGCRVADVWTYFMTEEATSVDEFRNMHKSVFQLRSMITLDALFEAHGHFYAVLYPISSP